VWMIGTQISVRGPFASPSPTQSSLARSRRAETISVDASS
jgi:hypothetical protein